MWSVYIQAFVALAIGIYLGDKVSAGDTAIFILSFVIAIAIRKIIFKKFSLTKLILILICSYGIFGYHYSTASSNRAIYPLNDKYITMVGKIVDIPYESYGKNVYCIKLKNGSYLNNRYKIKEQIQVKSSEKFKFGDVVRFSGFLETFPKVLNSGDFDTARNYQAKGIYFKMYADEMELSYQKINSYDITYYVTWLKNKISDWIYDNFQGDEAATLKAILTGYRTDFSPELKDLLYESNTMRLFYPAYMHILLLISLVSTFAGIVSRKKRDIILIVFLVLYAIFNFNFHYIAKSALLVALMAFSKTKFGYSSYIEILCALCTVIGAVNPLIFYESGFVLSVASNILIHYFTPMIIDKIGDRFSKRATKIIATWLVLTVGTIPLTAYFFNVTNPYSFLLSLLCIPLLGTVFMLTSLCYVLSLCNITIIATLSDGFLYLINKLPYLILTLPFNKITIPKPSILLIIAFYIVLFIIYRKYRKGKTNDFTISILSAIIAGFLLVCVTDYAINFNKLKINFVNVGQGDGAVISLPMRETILIDGGGTSELSEYDYGKSIFVPYLIRNGYSDIDVAIVSHYHQDHVKGIIWAMKKLNIREVIIPNYYDKEGYRDEIEDVAKKQKIKLSYLDAGQICRFKSGLSMRFISPDKKDLQREDENDYSYGIEIKYGDFSSLFMGDISENVERSHKGEWGKCNVLKVGHHGSRTSASNEFLDETKPNVAIISVGEHNPYYHPNSETLERLENHNTEVCRTDKHGNITITANKDGKFNVYSFNE